MICHPKRNDPISRESGAEGSPAAPIWFLVGDSSATFVLRRPADHCTSFRMTKYLFNFL